MFKKIRSGELLRLTIDFDSALAGGLPSALFIAGAATGVAQPFGEQRAELRQPDVGMELGGRRRRNVRRRQWLLRRFRRQRRPPRLGPAARLPVVSGTRSPLLHLHLLRPLSNPFQ